LALATLKVIQINTDLVEFLIPVTIAITALSNIFKPKSSSGKGIQINYLFALCFGLIHGLGFSNYLTSLLGKEQSIFTPLLAFNIGLANPNKIKGFGMAILLWLFLAVVYDGLFLISLVMFDDYPIDKFSLIASMFNPIDLSRILIILKLDISVLLGYTGALFQHFFGTSFGMISSLGVLLLWCVIPIRLILHQAKNKDF